MKSSCSGKVTLESNENSYSQILDKELQNWKDIDSRLVWL